MPKASEAVGVVANWMREDEWEIGQTSFALFNEVDANGLLDFEYVASPH